MIEPPMASPVAHRDDAGSQQDQRQRLEQPAHDRARRPLDARPRVAVRPKACEALGGVRGGQACEAAAQLLAELIG